MTTVQNSIQREIHINASAAKIYDAIANPEQVVRWFPTTLEGKYEVGEQPVFGFGDHGKSQIQVVDAKPVEYFAYRWVPGANHYLGDVTKVKSTLVEFRIVEQANGSCTLTLTESGFADLPEDVIEASFQQNSNGWDFMLGRLAALFETNS